MSEPLSSEERELLGDWWDSDWPDTQAGAMGTLYAAVERILAARLAALTAEVRAHVSSECPHDWTLRPESDTWVCEFCGDER